MTADTSRAQVRFIKESTWGEIPATPTMKNLNVTGEGLGLETSTTNSNNIRSDTNRAGTFRTGANASGDLSIEMQYGGYDEFFEGAFRNEFGTALDVTATTISIDASDNSFNDSGNGFGNAKVGQWFKASGSTDDANNGYFKVTAATAGKLTVTGGTLVTEAAGNSVTIKGDFIKNGTDNLSFTLEKEFSDIAAGSFVSFTGMRVGSANLSITPGELITGGLNFIGKGAAFSTSSIATTITDAETTDSMNAVDNVKNVFIDESPTTIDLTEISFSFDTGTRPQQAIGSLDLIGVGTGTLTVEGTLEAYFEDPALYQNYLNFTDTALAFVVEDGEGNAYVFDFPLVNFTAGNPTAPGIDQDVLLPLNFTATLDSTFEGTMGLTRIAA